MTAIPATKTKTISAPADAPVSGEAATESPGRSEWVEPADEGASRAERREHRKRREAELLRLYEDVSDAASVAW